MLAAAALDEGLALEVAELAGLVRGYGDVRRRLSAALVRSSTRGAPRGRGPPRGPAGFARSAEIVRAGGRRLLADENASSLTPHGRG